MNMISAGIVNGNQNSRTPNSQNGSASVSQFNLATASENLSIRAAAQSHRTKQKSLQMLPCRCRGQLHLYTCSFLCLLSSCKLLGRSRNNLQRAAVKYKRLGGSRGRYTSFRH
ncbi:hypothetical protein LINPERHAP1_LOCUS23050, partial [Linum perenne]